MIEREGGCLVVTVPLTMANARPLLEVGKSMMEQGEQVFDFSRVKEADSSAVALMLAWSRAAKLSRSTVKFAHIPAGVRALAELYGVADLLSLV